MFITQSFLYNVIFFTCALVLSKFYHVGNTAVYVFPFAIGNLIGPLVLGPFFDSWGRRKMIGSRGPQTGGYFLGAGLMMVGGVVALIFATDAERKSLEDIAEPLSTVGASTNGRWREYPGA